jgi:hypothetical protein
LGQTFDYLIANPPYGKDWKRDEDAVRAEHERARPAASRRGCRGSATAGSSSCCTCLRMRVIAAFLDRETARIDALVAKVREAIERLEELRTALISAAVTGKIDVREAEPLDAPQVTQ